MIEKSQNNDTIDPIYALTRNNHLDTITIHLPYKEYNHIKQIIYNN